MFLLHKFLRIINILTSKLQEKSSTLGNSAIIKSVIKSLEDYKTIECFAEIWLEINKFGTVNNTSIEKSENKKKRKEPNDLKNFVITASTSAQYMESTQSNVQRTEDFYRVNAYYVVLTP